MVNTLLNDYKYGDFVPFSKVAAFKKPEGFDAVLKKAPLDNELFKIVCKNFSKMFGFYCFGLDVLIDERDGSYNLIDFNAMPGYGKHTWLNESFNNFIKKYHKK